MWMFRRGGNEKDDDASWESYSSYEEYTDDEVEEHEEEHDQVEPKTQESGEEPKDTKEEPEKEEFKLENATNNESPAVEESVEELDQEKTPDHEEEKEGEPERPVENGTPEPQPEEDSDDDLVVVQPEEHTTDEEDLDPGLSFETTDESDLEDVEEEESVETNEEEESDDSEDDDDDEEEPSSLAEKQSLLALAAEHDRVDILKAILTENAQEQGPLLNSPIPPLHVAVCFGSTHATSCLLRMGANPAIRPNVPELLKSGEKHLKEMANVARYDDVSAWELAFGRTAAQDETEDTGKEPDKDETNKVNEESVPAKKGWFRGVFSSSKELTQHVAERVKEEEDEQEETSPSTAPVRRRRPTVKPVDMLPSKREGIRHAFTAEALRCIGGDEAQRLQQLLDSGMPADIDVGGKTLHGWCLEMGALGCEELIRPPKEENEGSDDEEEEEALSPENKRANEKKETPRAATAGASPMVSPISGDKESLPSLVNRLEELESLSTALSSCLDNLAEEVSVCHGLLLSGGGAAALASHVRSLKNLRERRQDELEHWTLEWEKSEADLSRWIEEYGGTTKYNNDFPTTNLAAETTKSRFSKLPEPQSAEEEESQRRQLLAQLAASENKVRKLRASITDLSEENTRDLEEVERRSLTGGVKLVRSLRDELREVEFKLSEAKSGEAACRARVNMIQSRLESSKKKKAKSTPLKTQTKDQSERDTQVPLESDAQDNVEPESSQKSREWPTLDNAEDTPLVKEEKRPSEVIASGHSTAITIHQPHGRYIPIDLWDILLRIIGMGREAVRRSADNIRGSTTSTVMIV